jgi:hypothetical protein
MRTNNRAIKADLRHGRWRATICLSGTAIAAFGESEIEAIDRVMRMAPPLSEPRTSIESDH